MLSAKAHAKLLVVLEANTSACTDSGCCGEDTAVLRCKQVQGTSGLVADVAEVVAVVLKLQIEFAVDLARVAVIGADADGWSVLIDEANEAILVVKAQGGVLQVVLEDVGDSRNDTIGRLVIDDNNAKVPTTCRGGCHAHKVAHQQAFDRQRTTFALSCIVTTSGSEDVGDSRPDR